MSMNDYLKLISITADIATLITVLLTVIYWIANKNKSLIGYYISNILVMLIKIAVILIFIVLIYRTIFEFIFWISFILFKWHSTNLDWESNYEIFHYLAYFIAFTFCSAFVWIFWTLAWNWNLESSKTFLNLFLPKKKQLLLKSLKNLNIISAEYGAKESYFNVTEKLIKMINDNTLTITATNRLAGDPIMNVQKKLVLKYKYDWEDEKCVEIPEWETIEIRP